MSGADASFGISAQSLGQLRRLFESTPDVERVWIFGSRATGRARLNSDIDLAFDAPRMDGEAARRLILAVDGLPTLYRIDALHWQGVGDPILRGEIERDRRVLWQSERQAADTPGR